MPQKPLVAEGHGIPLFKDTLQSGDLGAPESCGKLAHAVIVSQPHMGKPCAAIVPPLIDERTADRSDFRVIRNHHTPLSRGYLLVGVEGKGSSHSEAAAGTAFQASSKSLAAVLEKKQILLAGKKFKLLPGSGHTENVHEKHSLDPGNIAGSGFSGKHRLSGTKFFQSPLHLGHGRHEGAPGNIHEKRNRSKHE